MDNVLKALGKVSKSISSLSDQEVKTLLEFIAISRGIDLVKYVTYPIPFAYPASPWQITYTPPYTFTSSSNTNTEVE